MQALHLHLQLQAWTSFGRSAAARPGRRSIDHAIANHFFPASSQSYQRRRTSPIHSLYL